MNNSENKKNSILIPLLISIVIIIITIYAIISKIWFLIAIPVGFLFGFFLQKGDLCGSSAFIAAI